MAVSLRARVCGSAWPCAGATSLPTPSSCLRRTATMEKLLGEGEMVTVRVTLEHCEVEGLLVLLMEKVTEGV